LIDNHSHVRDEELDEAIDLRTEAKLNESDYDENTAGDGR
jgi:hypothetical protein